MHQSFSAVPIAPPPRTEPRALAFFKTNRQMPHGGDKQAVQMPSGAVKKIS